MQDLASMVGEGFVEKGGAYLSLCLQALSSLNFHLENATLFWFGFFGIFSPRTNGKEGCETKLIRWVLLS